MHVPPLAAALALCLLPGLALLPAPGRAQGHGHASHAAPAPGQVPDAAQAAAPAPWRPSEPGQGGFGALAEIVTLLRADPKTDWSKVSLARLRRHLNEMDSLVTELEVSEAPLPGGLVITIARDAPGAAAAWAMVPAHAPVLEAETGWHSAVTVEGARLTWVVTGPAAEAEIRALGFFGLMATGNHHPEHHLAIARDPNGAGHMQP